ncbi:MAG: ROK family protein, partial [Anaerolineae bacterium]|nr:ROK family protein [Anaerolineae bacterium]
MVPLYGGIEAGGTKFVCAIGSGPDDIRAEMQVPTTTPDETIDRTVEFFREWRGRLSAIGIASFGPVELNPLSPTYGYITSTPKPGWANTDVVHAIQYALDLPVGFDTDVNGAALKVRWGKPAEILPPDHPAWRLEGHYLALALVNLICTLSPQRVILGGGVMKERHLFSVIRAEVQELLNGYVQPPEILNDIDHYIVPPTLGGRAGVLGAIALAERAVPRSG